jgi:hypothetical protein
MEAATFNCSICGDASRVICIFCTKDACSNHICQRCHRCSDCCACEMPVTSSSEEERGSEEAGPAAGALPKEAAPESAAPEEEFEVLTPAS